MPVEIGEAETPGCAIALIEIIRRVGNRLATPVRATDARAVPQVNRVSPAQENALVAFATVPAIFPYLGAGAVPHDQADPAPFRGDEVFDVTMVAGERLAGVAGLGDNLAADFIRARGFQDDGRLRRFAALLRDGRMAKSGEQQCRSKRLQLFPAVRMATNAIH